MKILKKIGLGILLGIVAIFALLVLAFGVALLLECLLAPEDYLFYECGQLSGEAMIGLLMVPVILLCCTIAQKTKLSTREKMEENEELLYFWNRLGKWKTAVIAIWLLLLYCCFTNVTFVTENKIIAHTPINPSGIEYSYSDVEEIETGFGKKTLSIYTYKEKGSFYYTITLDGKKKVFHSPSPNGDIKRYEEHTYLELEEFDAALTKLKIPKKASIDGYEHCDYDKEYIERFLRIASED